MTESSRAENIAETLAKTQRDPYLIKGDPIDIICLPPGWTVTNHNKEEYSDQPTRKKGNIVLDDTESFIEYVKDQMQPGYTNIYCKADYSKNHVSFRAIFDDHGSGEYDQQWRDHIADYEPRFSEEWKRWIGNNQNKFTQAEFAMFIERNLNDIASVEGMPNGTQLLEMATSFEANQDMRFKSAIRLQSGGVQMNFVNDDDEQTLAKMKMFDRISIGIPVFWNGEYYRVDARLRYRVKEGLLIFWYELIREDKVIEDATKNLIDNIAQNTNIKIFFGEPFGKSC